MTKIFCSDSSCKFINDQGRCTAKTVTIGWSSVMTVYEGRQDFHRCKTYEESEKAKEIKAFLDKVQRREGDGR